MTDYAWYPVSGNGQTQATEYIWNVGTFNWNTGSYWTDLSDLTSPPTTGTVPGSGTGTSGGTTGQDNAYLIAGQVPSYAFSPPFYTPNGTSKPYIGSTNFPVNVLYNSGFDEIGTLGLGGYNPFGGGNYPTLDIEGATLDVTGPVVGTYTKTFPAPFGEQTASGGGTIELGTAGVLDIGGTVDSSILVDFVDGDSDLLGLAASDAAAPSAFAGTIGGFTSGDIIDLSGFAYAAGSTATLSGNTLTVSDGSGTVDLTLANIAAGTTFNATADTGTGIDITIACYAAGTRIRTTHGDIAVELLRVGDRAITAGGTASPIVWIGDRRIDCRRHRRPELVRPVRIRAGALGENLPARDLLLSPDHALFVEGVLIPAKHLVNGSSIVQEQVDSVHYFHVELERHDVLLAENLPAESYLDTGNRAEFSGGPRTSLHADFTALHRDGACAPLCVSGPVLAHLRRRVQARAARFVRANAPYLLADGRRIHAVRRKGSALSFVLAPGTRAVKVPAEAAGDSVLVNGRRVTLDAAHRVAPESLGRGPIVLELLMQNRTAHREARTA